MEILADKFNRKAQSIEGWTTGKDEELKQNDDLEEANLAGIQVTTIRKYILILIICVQALQKIHQTFETDLQAETSRVDGLAAIANELTYVIETKLVYYVMLYNSELNYHDCESVNKRLEDIRQLFANLQDLSEDRKMRIQVKSTILSKKC